MRHHTSNPLKRAEHIATHDSEAVFRETNDRRLAAEVYVQTRVAATIELSAARPLIPRN